MIVNLGALFAAGHSPNDLADLTWPQVTLMVEGVQQYHLDLAARIATGKSPVMEAAPVSEPGSSPMRADTSSPDNRADVQKELNKVAQFQNLARVGQGSQVKVLITKGAPPE